MRLRNYEDDGGSIDDLDADELKHARLMVCGIADDATQARKLLEMLGLIGVPLTPEQAAAEQAVNRRVETIRSEIDEMQEWMDEHGFLIEIEIDPSDLGSVTGSDL